MAMHDVKSLARMALVRCVGSARFQSVRSRLHSPKMLRAVFAALLIALAFPAVAAHVEVQAGRSYTDNDGSTAVFVEGVLDEHQLGRSAFTWAPDVSIGWIHGHDISGFRNDRYDPRKGVLVVAGGVRFHYGAEGAWYRPLFFSFQPAYANRRTLALGTPYEFVSTLGWQGRRFSFQIRHISNGDLDTPNRGETMALIGVGFDL